MQVLKPHQLLAVFLSATASTLIMYLMFNIFQALCFGIVVGVFVYAFLISMEEKKPKKPNFPSGLVSQANSLGQASPLNQANINQPHYPTSPTSPNDSTGLTDPTNPPS